jgi:hypothetical protein
MRSSEPANSPSSSSRLLATGVVSSPIATLRASSRRRTTSRAMPAVPRAATSDPISAATAVAPASSTKSSLRASPRNHHRATAVRLHVNRPGSATWAARWRPKRPRRRWPALDSSASGTPFCCSTSSGGAARVSGGSADERVWR